MGTGGCRAFAGTDPTSVPIRPVYAEVAPSPALAPWVECYWSARGVARAGLPNRVLPDGCADVLVSLAGPPRAVAVGPMRAASVVALAGAVDLFGVRFRPGAGGALLGTALDALCDRDAALDALWGPLAAELEERLAGAAPADRVRHAESVLRARLPASRREDDVVARAVALMRRARGRAGVCDVAAALSVGERWLERAFARHVGYGPKTLARVVRLQHAVRLALGPARPWTDVAYAAGYADQAHLVREFRALAGVTPAAYARERGRVGFVQYGGGDGD